jgi:hypothetical protein
MSSFVCEVCGGSYDWNDPSRPPGICGDCYLRNSVGAPIRGRASSARGKESQPFAVLWPIVGALAGAWIAYLARPSAFLIGQLPFEVVITGGAQLTGIDSILAPLARRSLSLMVAGAVIGALVGLGYQRIRPRGPRRTKTEDGDERYSSGSSKRNRSRTPSAVAGSASFGPAVEILTNRGVLDLLHAGIGEALIVEKIRSSDCDFDLAANDLIELKSLGLSERVLGAMLTRQGGHGGTPARSAS